MKRLRDTCQCERNLRIGGSGTTDRPFSRLGLRIKGHIVSVAYAKFDRDASYKDQVLLKEVEVSDDLRTLVVLFCGSLVPAGVLADRIEEEHTALAPVAEFLREWDRLEGV